jgi:hypothetical protein
MAEGGHMLVQEHMGIVNAEQYGTTRDYATLSATLGAIGSRDAILLLPFVADGVWTFNTVWTIPTNVTLWIAPGVTIGGTANFTINGGLVTFNSGGTWYVGSGTGTLNFKQTTFGAMQASLISGIAGVLRGTATAPPTLTLQENVPNQSANMFFNSGVTPRGTLGLNGDQNITLLLQNSAKFIMSGGNVGIGMIPTTQLELSTGGAQKSTGTTWTNPSDRRLKTILRPYEDGLALICQIHPLWVTYNGLGGVQADGQEHITVIADEVLPIAPYMVGSYKARLHPDDMHETDILNYDGHAMTFALVNAVQELKAENDMLRAQLTDLVARLAALEAKPAA